MFGWTLEYIRGLTPGEFQRASKMATRVYGMELMYLMRVVNMPWISDDTQRRQVAESIEALANGRLPVDQRLPIENLRAQIGGG